MTFLFAALTVVFATGLGMVGWLYLRAIQRLNRYQGIRDVEKYQADCEQQAKQAIAKHDQALADTDELGKIIQEQKNQVVQYKNVLGNFQSATELKQHIQKEKQKLKDLVHTVGEYKKAAELATHITRQQAHLANQQQELQRVATAIGAGPSAAEVMAQIQYNQNYLAELRDEVESVEEARELQAFGFYRTRYAFDSAEAYKQHLDSIRGQQKQMLKQESAAQCDTDWTVDGSKAEGRKMVKQQIKLMLRAFNGECDAAVSKARYNNVVSLENRINRSYEQINKLGQTKKVYLTNQYLSLKLQELYLAHEHQEKKQDEKEEQRRIREQMREEEKVIREVEKARDAAEKEEANAEKALQKAREDLARESGKQTAALQALVTRLENELKDALDRKAKAIARAQLTKSGHVYVLSNIGSFGEGVYKIGMTRRLEPLERVKELGDASVPFYFDVHAMIYSEDAPALEKRLHNHFASRRVNMINLRREFFRVSLEDIRHAVKENFGEVTFVTVPEAEQYRQTLALRAEESYPKNGDRMNDRHVAPASLR